MIRLSASICLLALCLGHPLSAQVAAPQELPLDPNLGISTLPLWPGVPPHTSSNSTGTVPSLTLFRPQQGKANGTAVIIAPGGAYVNLAARLEGREVADWFTSHGVTAFVLRYRLGADNLYPIPLEDAQRAVRLVRSQAQQLGFSANRIGFVGFSAGGHLAAMAGTLFDDGQPTSADPIERLSNRPDFLVLGYPWLNAMQPNDRNLITYCSILKTVPPADCKRFEQQYSPTLHVTAKTPTTFIYSTSDDETVPVSASVDFYSALIQANVPAELHIFRHGGHGSGLGLSNPSLDVWPSLLEQWLREQGLLTPGH
jgi:acetyl esterase/lipase